MMPPKNKRQTLMFSATFPDEIQSAAKTYLKDDYLFLGVGLVGGACADVSQSILEVEEFKKREKLVEILEAGDKMDKTIVFVETKKQADFLASFLSQNEVIVAIFFHIKVLLVIVTFQVEVKLILMKHTNIGIIVFIF